MVEDLNTATFFSPQLSIQNLLHDYLLIIDNSVGLIGKWKIVLHPMNLLN